MKLIYLYRRFGDQGNLDAEHGPPSKSSEHSQRVALPLPALLNTGCSRGLFDQEKVRDVGGALWTAF